MKLFVYGTLKERAKRSGGKPATIKGLIYDLGPFPAVLLGGQELVQGITFDVTDQDLKELDRYEGVPRLYTREKTNATHTDGEQIEVWVYQFAREIDKQPIKSGMW